MCEKCKHLFVRKLFVIKGQTNIFSQRCDDKIDIVLISLRNMSPLTAAEQDNPIYKDLMECSQCRHLYHIKKFEFGFTSELPTSFRTLSGILSFFYGLPQQKNYETYKALFYFIEQFSRSISVYLSLFWSVWTILIYLSASR